jgi:hypothetical protein
MSRPLVLRPCTVCGCNGNGSCNRVIDPRDGGVLPLRDTGYRHNAPTPVVRPFRAPEREAETAGAGR